MKNTLILAAVLAVIVGLTALNTASSEASLAGCPPGCESTLSLSTGIPYATGTWCGNFEARFQADGNGNFQANCLCAGTYYFCLDNDQGVYYGTVSGAPTESPAIGPFDMVCPCN